MSDLIYRFSQQPQTLLTNIGQGINLLGQQAKAKKKEEDYQGLLAQHRETGDRSLIPLIQAAKPELFEGWKSGIDMMTADEQKNQLQQNVSVYGLIETGDIEGAINTMEGYAQAYENSNEPAEAKEWRGMIEKAKTDPDALASLLDITSSVIPGANDAFDQIRDMNKDVREEGKYWLGVMESGAELGKSQVELDAMQAAFDADPTLGPVIQQAINFGTAVEGGYSPEAMEVTKLLQGIDTKFFKRKEDYNKAVVSNQQFQDTHARVLELAADPNTTVFQQGAADLKMFNIWMRQIDDATVRKDDVSNIKALNALRDQIGLVAAKLGKGAMLSADQRASMALMSEDYLGAQKSFVDKEVFPGLYAGFLAVNPSGERYKEAFGNWVNPLDTTDKKVPVDDGSSGEGNMGANAAEVEKVRDFYISAATASIAAKDGLWTQAELNEINDPNTTLERLKEMGGKTWDAYNASKKPEKETPVVPTTGIYGIGG